MKHAGIELSEYFMPGLGGEKYSRQNALHTADAMNQINPDFIRIRTLAIPESTELFKDYQAGAFLKIDDMQNPELLKHAENTRKTHKITLDNLEKLTDEMMR